MNCENDKLMVKQTTYLTAQLPHSSSYPTKIITCHNKLTSHHPKAAPPCGMPLGISPGGQYSQLGPSLLFTMPAGQSWHWPSFGTGHRSATTVPQRWQSVQAKESDTWGRKGQGVGHDGLDGGA